MLLFDQYKNKKQTIVLKIHLLVVAKNENYNVFKKLNCKKIQSGENTKPIKEKIRNTCSSFTGAPNEDIVQNQLT